MRELHLNVTSSNPVQRQQVQWRHNGNIISADERKHIGYGGLVIRDANPSDAGCYFVVINTGSQCESMHFNVVLECELKV